ncbi:DNA topoisomerase VI [Bdellovibrio svalbardensis]|uniref:DNA topoisomerase (ATP-hydrolyzing) n=1 Tax=Bdellovibrio svalbardensis TaxID=2972972 RepID=A0ABT6DMJ9_9BACT|nr:DNA topoisomerase VI [Bdellovibrio svalbardensis]MDG0818096.1 DNA topoisomerase VI [Bdellovibrio svalbardensis]
MARLLSIRELKIDIPKEARILADKMLKDLENSKRPVLEAIKTSLDNSLYNSKVGYLTPGDKMVRTELNVSSVQKLARVVFVLEILLRNMEIGSVNTKRELYYICKGLIKGNSRLKPLDFEDQPESDAIIDFIGDMLEVYREELNCFANERGGQTYSQQLIVTETMPDGDKATVDLSTLGTAAFQPKNRPQALKLKAKKKIDFCLIVESEGTANTLVSMGFTKRNNCILMGAGGVPSNGVRGWCKLIQHELDIPLYFFGDLDAYTMQNIFRTLKAGSAASLVRNADFSAPEVKFLGVLPEDVKRYDLPHYKVKESDPAEARALKKAKDALENDPFFLDRKNKNLADILRWLIKEKVRCEQQSFFSVDPNDPIKTEKLILEKIKRGSYV